MKSIQAVLTLGLIQLVASSPTRVKRQNLSATVTGVDLQLPTNAFGSAIEGTGVNKQGDMFAADFRAGGLAPSSSYAFFNQANGGTANILSNQNPFFTALNNTPTPPLLAGSRFLRDGRVLFTGVFSSLSFPPDLQLTRLDANNKRVLSFDKASNDVHTFCTDQRMLQPNDLALSTMRDTLIFLSGQNFTADTIAGQSGDLWTCDGGLAI